MEAFVVWQNTDLTEGRGRVLPIRVCKTEATARRLAKKQDVQGSDCMITCEAIEKGPGGHWYGPVALVEPTTEDRNMQLGLDRQAEAKERRENAIEKARQLGLTDEDLAALRGETK